MKKKKISETIITNFGQDLYERALELFDRKIRFLIIKENPLEIRCIIFEKDQIFHLIIDERKHKIYHDCPSILFNQTFPGEPICIHIIKVLLLIDENITMNFLRDYQTYAPMTLFSEILKEKKKNLYLLIKNSIELKDRVDLKMNTPKSSHYLERKSFNHHLNYLIENNFFLECFNFLNHFDDKNRNEIIEKYSPIINLVLEKLISSISNYSLLRLIRNLNQVEKFTNKLPPNKKTLIYKQFLDNLSQRSDNFTLNHKYCFYFIAKKLVLDSEKPFSSPLENIELNDYQNFLKDLIEHLNEENYSAYTSKDIIILKSQLNTLDVLEDDYELKLRNMQNYMVNLEREFFLKKFAFFKLLLKRNRIERQKFQYRRYNDVFIVEHNSYNIKDRFYVDYLLPHLGFFGEKKNIVKARDIGENYYIFDRIFSIDWNAIPSISYFKKKMWGDFSKFHIKSNQGLTLLRYGVDYIKDGGMEFVNNKEIMIIEWDLINKPFLGSNVIAYDEGIIIPDSENPLFFDIKPFDLCYCKMPPKEINRSCRIIEPISKCSFKDAIESVAKGISFIEGFYPLSLIKKILSKEITYDKAIKMLEQSQKRKFVPHFYQFIYEFKEFLFNILLKEDLYLFNQTGNHSFENLTFIFSFLKLDKLLSGIEISIEFFFPLLSSPNLTRDSLRKEILSIIHQFIRNLLDKKELGSTSIFDINKMKGTPFSMYTNEILTLRKEEFETSLIPVYKEKNNLYHDISHVSRTYYGQKILVILKMKKESILNKVLFDKFKEIANKLGLTLKNLANQGSNFS